MNLKAFVAAVIIASISSIAVAEDCHGDKEIEVLALNMYHEARGEPADGMQMVGEVTLNRMWHESYPDTVCEVVYQPSQFSWTRVKKDHTPYEEEMWDIALELAEDLINGDVEYFGNGATHFINPYKLSRMPNWTRAYDNVGKIGNHIFYAM
jgi:spore germination cell wall hydrolase CwlJ-like protein